MWGLLATASLITAGITLPDYTGGTRLGALGEIGDIWGNPGTQFGLLDGGGQIATAPDSSFCVIKDNRGVRTRSYQFWWEKGGVRDSLIVAATDTLDLYVQPGEALQLTAQDGGWPLVSGPVTFEVAPEGGTIQCRVLGRSVTHFSPYVMMTKRLAKPWAEAGWDFLAQGNPTRIGLPAGEEFEFVIRAVDPRYDFLLRGASPPIRVQTFVEAEPVVGPSVFRAWWVNGWTQQVAFEDSLGSETSSIDPATVQASDFVRLHDGVEKNPTSVSEMRWGWYFSLGGSREPGVWETLVLPGAVADTLGNVNADTLRSVEVVSP